MKKKIIRVLALLVLGAVFPEPVCSQIVLGGGAVAGSTKIRDQNSLIGCGASDFGSQALDQSTCGNVTTDGSVLSYEPNYVDASATAISTCGTTISNGGSHKLTADLACAAGSAAITISPPNGQGPGFYLNLNGHAVTGTIVGNDASGARPDGMHVFGGTVTCNVSGAGCFSITFSNNTPPLTQGIALHHLTVQNTNDNGGMVTIDGTMTGVMAGGAYSVDIHHIETIISGGTAGDPNRSGSMGVSGYNHTVHFRNLYVHNSAGTNHGASEGVDCYHSQQCDIEHNRFEFNQMTLANGTVGRMVLVDGDAFGNGVTTPGFTENANIHHNYFKVNDTRAMRQRSARRVLFHDNLVDGITDAPIGPSYLAAIHAGDPTSAQGATSTYDYLSSLYNYNRFIFIAPTVSGAVVAHVMNAIGIAFNDNTITCSGTGCSGDTQNGAFLQASIQVKTGTQYFDLTACRNTVTGLITPLYANGSGQTQTSTIHHLTSGTCTAVGAATCDALGTCP